MTRALRRAIWAVATLALLAASTPTVPAAQANPGPYEGFKALVVEPERSFTYDSAIFGALEERGFETSYGPIPQDAATLGSYDLVALSTRRRLTEGETQLLKDYVARGGAVYGSWGGPMGSARFLTEVCKVAAVRSVWIRQMELLKSPLSRGIGQEKVTFPDRVGHLHPEGDGYEVVAVQPLGDAIPVARDAQGNVLGVLSQHGKGRAAVLGLGPEQDKYYVEHEVAPAMMDNLLSWLLEGKTEGPARPWSNRITVSLPAAAQIVTVELNGRTLAQAPTRQVGSVKRVSVDVSTVAPGKEARIKVSCKPLARAGHVETVAHLAWGTLSSAADSPAKAAQYLASLNVEVCIPLVRGSYGQTWYRGMPEDSRPDEKTVKHYQGDFLADLVRECHDRGIRVVPDVYFDHSTPLRKYPDVRRVDRGGIVIKNQYGSELACFNDPRGQEHNLATIRQLLDNYKLDGVILDDNFELDQDDCFCPYCKDGFKRYCEAHGIPYADPSEKWEGPTADTWRQYKRQATRELAARVTKISREQGVPAGGWVSVGMNSMHMAPTFDFLGGMVYTVPPRALRGPLSVMGDHKYICLLWALNRTPQDMERDVTDSVRAGCASVGFWMAGEDGGYQMDPQRSEAIRRSLGRVEQEWLDFYRDGIVTGDARFAVLGGKAGADGLTVRVKNTGQRVKQRLAGKVDVSALK